MRKHWIPFLITLLFVSPATAVELVEEFEGGREVTLMTLPPPPSVILDIPFEAHPGEVKALFKNMDLKPIKLTKADSLKEPLKLFAFEGSPSQLWVDGGKTTVLFHNNKLVRIDLLLPPTYENFLVAREQVLTSLGDRFTVKETKETMDHILKSHLSLLKPEEYSKQTEVVVREALNRGTTFFYYGLQDNRNQVNVTLSFHSKRNEQYVRVPRLHMHFSIQSGMELIQKDREIDTGNILPE